MNRIICDQHHMGAIIYRDDSENCSHTPCWNTEAEGELIEADAREILT